MIDGERRRALLKARHADSGIMVSTPVLTAEPVEATPLPVAPIELVAKIPGGLGVGGVADADVPGATTVPATALVACDPPTEAPRC